MFSLSSRTVCDAYVMSAVKNPALPSDIHNVVMECLDDMIHQEELRGQVMAQLCMNASKKGLLDYENQEKLRIRTKNEILWLRIESEVDAMVSKFTPNQVQGGLDSAREWLTDFAWKTIWNESNKDKAKKYATKALVLLESFPIVMHMWSKATCWKDILVSFVAAYKMITGGSIVMAMLDFEAWIAHIIKITTGFGPEWSIMHASVQSGTDESTESASSVDFQWIVEGARKVVDGTKNVMHCAAVGKLKTLCCYLFSFGLCDKFNIPYKHLNLEVIADKSKKVKYSSVPEFVLAIVDTVVWFAERAVQAVHMKSFSPLLHNAQNYEAWVNRFYEIRTKSKLVALPEEATKIDLTKFAFDLHQVVEDGEQMIRWATNADEKKSLRIFVSEAHVIEAEYLTSVMARAPRRAPLCVLVEGDSSVGKSSVKDLLAIHHAKYKNLPTTNDCIWTRTPTDKFYSGVSSRVHTIILDDVAFLNPATGQLDPSIADIIQLCNNVSFCPPMASLEEKGKTPLHPQLLIGSTNTVELNATAYFKCPLAVRRRFPFVVHVEPKNKYKDSNGFLDGKAVPVCQVGEFPDLWDFTIFRVVAQPGVKAGNSKFEGYSVPQLDELATFSDDDESSAVKKLLLWFNRVIDNHGRIQDKVMEAVRCMHQVSYCSKCGLPCSMCVCEEDSNIQADTEEGEVDPIADALTRNEVNRVLKRNNLPHDEPIDLLERFHDCAEFEHIRSDLERIMTMREHSNGVTIQEVDEVLTWRDAMEDDSEVIEEDLRTVNAYYAYAGPAEQRTMREKARAVIDKFCDDTMCNVHIFAGMAQYGFESIVNKASTFYRDAMGKLGCTLAKYSLLYCKKLALEQFKAIGQNISNKWTEIAPKFCNVLNLLRVISFGVGFTIGYKVVSSLLSPASEIQAEPGTRPEKFVKDEEPNPWLKEDFRLSRFHVGAKTIGWNNMTHTQVCERLLAQVAKVQFNFVNTSGKIDHTTGVSLCVGGHVWITGNHVIPESVTQCVMTIENAPNQVNKNVTFALENPDVYRNPDKDLAFFYTSARPPQSHVKELFMERECPGMCLSGNLLTRDLSGEAWMYDIADVCYRNLRCPAPLNRTWQMWTGQLLNQPTQNGDCGSPLVCRTGRGPVILGLHVLLSAGHYSGSIPLFQKDIEQGISFFGSQVQDGTMRLVEEYGPLHEKSVFRWQEVGTAEVFGSAKNSAFRVAPKSKVVPTLISEAAQKQGFVKRCAPPALKGKGPWEKGILDTLTMEYKLPRHLVVKCADAYVSDVLSGVSKEQLAELIILDDKTAMNGYPGVKFIDKINRNTSMGYPYRKSKQLFLESVDGEGIWSDPKMYTPQVMDNVHEIEDCYLRGERAMAVFIAALKDEPTPLEKVKIEKTRIFQMMNAEVALVVRKYLLTFIRLFQSNPLLFEGAPGLNCTSPMWGKLREYLVQHGLDRLIAGDYGKYDKRMEPVMILVAFYMIGRVLAAAGWSEKHLLAVAAMGEDIAFALVYFQGDLVMLIGSNPSGQPLTVIINCLVNSLYMRICFDVLSCGRVSVREFKKYVSLITYGDDNAMGSAVDWFNHTAISETLAKFGIVYTMADKHTASVPFIHIDDVSFLKRKWRWSDDTKMWMCPLEWASMEKTLTMCVKSDSLCPEAQSAEAISSVVGEFFQYGRQVYDENVEKMKSIVAECGLQAYVRKSIFCSYDERVENYIHNTNRDMQASLPDFLGENILQSVCDLAPSGDAEYCCTPILNALR